MRTLIPPPHDDGCLDALLAIASRAVEQARSRGADAAEAFVQSAAGRSISLEKDALSSASQGGEAGLSLRVVAARRVGFAYASTPAGIADAVAAALESARHAAPADFVFPAGGGAPAVAGLWDDRIVARTAAQDVADARALVAAARDVGPGVHVAGGSIGHGAEASAIVNSEGLEASHRGTMLGMGAYTVARRGDEVATGHFSHEATTVDAMLTEPGAIGTEAGGRAAHALGAQPYDGGTRSTVLLAPDAFAGLLEFMMLPAFLGERAARGESFFAGREKEVVADTRLRLVDDPTRPGGLGSAPTDDEGLPSRPAPLLVEGLLGPYLFDVAASYRYGDGASSQTASGVRTGGLSDDRSYQDPPTATPRNIVLEVAEAQPLERLIGMIDDGLLVLDVLGAHTGNPTSGDFSVTTTQVWRIKAGERTEPVQGAMLSGSLPRLLQEAFYGASREREQVAGHFSPTGLDLPYVALRDVTTVGA